MRAWMLMLVAAGFASAQDVPAVWTEAPAAETGQGAPHGVGILDWSSDGKPDVVIVQIRPAGINLFLNDGKGGLKGDFNKMLSTRMGPNFGMGCNADGDAFLDFIQLDTNSCNLSVYKGAKGKLQDIQETSLNLGWPISAYPCDMNGDRKPDMVVCGWPDPIVDKTPGRIKVLMGPTWKESVVHDIPECGESVGGVDFNGDKRADVVSTDQKAGALLLFWGDGRGLISKPVSVPIDGADGSVKSKDLTIADFNGDKQPDLAVALEDKSFMLLLKCDGKGGFTQMKKFDLPSKARFTATGDFNGDKNLDLALGSSELGQPWHVTVYLGDGKGEYTKNCEFKGEGYFHFYSYAVGDYDLDKKDDLVITTIGKDEVSGQVRRFLTKK